MKIIIPTIGSRGDVQPSIPRPKLNRKGLVPALKELVRNGQLHTTAAALGEKIRAENGIDNAVRLIEETFCQ